MGTLFLYRAVDATTLAPDFDTFARAFVLGDDRAAHQAKERAHARRGMAARWKKLDDAVASSAETHPMVRNMRLRARGKRLATRVQHRRASGGSILACAPSVRPRIDGRSSL